MERDAINGARKRDEQLFLRTFSKQLAVALRVKDEEEVNERERLRIASALGNSSSKLLSKDDETTQIERLQSTYVELCHDDPIITGGDEDCRRLAKALIPKQIKTKLPRNAKSITGTRTTLALSSRLVDGILQATSRAVEKTRTINHNSNDGANTEYMFGPSKVTTSEGYAQIAFAIFIEGPYRCIQQAENLEVASQFLGSFEPPLRTPSNELSSDVKAHLMDKATANIVNGMAKLEVNSSCNQNHSPSIYDHDDASSSSSDFFLLPNPINDANQSSTDDNDSMNEIYAEESDPDDYDYDYGTNDVPCDSMQTKIDERKSIDEYNGQYEMSFNPIQLSEPSQANQTFEGACKSIHYLLSVMSYSKLALGSLSSRAWSEGGMSETLADLSFLMLLEVTNKENHGIETKANSLFQLMLNDDENTDIATLWDRPLLVLRDRALDKKHDYDALPSYLQLLIALLAQPLTKNFIPPTLMVGLSCLGEICSSKEMVNTESGQTCATSVWSVCPREEVKKAIMTSLHSLARIVEDVRQRDSVGNGKSVQETNPWIRTIVCIIPMIEYLTNLKARFDFQPVFEGVGSRKSTLSESDAQAISESGLFREMLFVFTKYHEDGVSNLESPNAKEVVRLQLLRTIFTLSVQSPEVLGLYALRVPDFASEVHSSTFLDTHLVDGILWLSMGSYLLENKSGQSYQPRLKLRTGSCTNATATPKETKSLAERSINGFASLCETTRAVLQRLNQTFQISQGGTLSDEQQKECCVACNGALRSIVVFSNCLSTCPSMTKIWVESLNSSDDATAIAREQIAQLKSTLTSIPSFPDEETKTYHLGPKKDDDIEGTPVEDSGIPALHDEASPKMLTMMQFRKEYKSVVGSVWSSVKIISLALESHTGSSLSKTD